MSRRSFQRRKRKYAKMRPDDLKKLYTKSHREVDQAFSDQEVFDALPDHEQKRMLEMREEQFAMSAVIFDRTVSKFATMGKDDLQKLYDKYQPEVEQAFSEQKALNALPDHEQKSLLGKRDKLFDLSAVIERRKSEERRQELREFERKEFGKESKQRISWEEIFRGVMAVVFVLYLLNSA